MNNIDIKEYSVSNKKTYFFEQIEANRNRQVIKTPWEGLNKQIGGGLYPGLYCLGAVSSLGKTAFSLQLADYIASEGTPVLFYSLEMPAMELMSRSISRLLFEDMPKEHRHINTLKILNGDIDDDTLRDFADDYFTNMKNLSIFEGDFDTGIDDILRDVKKFIDKIGVKPVVFVDYLQILKPKKEYSDIGKQHEKYMNERQQTENVVKNLKKLSRFFGITVFVVSSFNRTSYKSKVSFESFKESGLIEYTSDVVMGLQLSVLDDNKSKDIDFDKEKEKMPRDITLSVLKQRNGKSFITQKFNFYPANNFFKESAF